MKKTSLFIGLLSIITLLTSCSKTIEDSLGSKDNAEYQVAKNQDTGDGTLKLMTTSINVKDNELEFMTSGIDENKLTFIYVANQKVFEQKIKNNQDYKINIKKINNAHRTDYKSKVQLVQYSDDTENGDITTFKQQRYSVEE
ncbi:MULTISPECIES: hypothetical protein [unclassified Enterococcus]|uniref:hypothetical protein n=1 Tax=unclassified Enterococcus TaxID=2608891 RepID=UPI0015523F5C|nr:MULTISPECIES: hypothetical protein [unclassified Enterococcus]MBS7576539.1 hypothetical protein [Enterococcus sp. MMGLQ5-2]MBS7583974.1 hypothetical protein [Enterococcus sp. MMGLQ5-1]NPD11835.1 hypothetical protein [Enterococcus sp. MMGLQ5-1]NPD36376.1 hypothetical protein [Enterococcus sp. MMGLQ5-2]